MSDKKELRKHFSEVRRYAKDDLKDDSIAARLLYLDDIKNADTVLLYASFGSEVDTWKTSGKLIEMQKNIAFPKCG